MVFLKASLRFGMALMLLACQPEQVAMRSEDSALILPTTVDFDGDGRTDMLTGDLHQPQGYVKARAVMGDGRTLLLPLGTAGVPAVHSVLVADAGGPLPVVVTTRETGGSIGSLVEAFAYDARTRSFQRLAWDGLPTELVSVGLHPSFEGPTQTVVIPYRMHDPVRHTLLKKYRYHDGQMDLVQIAYGPAAQDLPYPAEDWAVLIAAFNTIGLRLPAETQRYFAVDRTGEAFYAKWQRTIPEGMTFYLDRKYETGLSSGTFSIWGNTVSPSGKRLNRAVGLQGVVSFTTLSDRKVISAIDVREVPLRVVTPEQVMEIVRNLPEAKDLVEIPPPVFLEGQWQVNILINSTTTVIFVDARTGQVNKREPDDLEGPWAGVALAGPVKGGSPV
jgi:hypothetical protein